MAGWWFFATPLKNDGVKVNGQDDIPYICENPKIFETTTFRFPSVGPALGSERDPFCQRALSLSERLRFEGLRRVPSPQFW